MNCYKVKVKTTNSTGNITKDVGGAYLHCSNGVLYVTCSKYSDVERVVDSQLIKSIELVGLGYNVK